MNNQKDTQKTDKNISPLGGNIPRLDTRNALDYGVYDFANKKTEKLVTALYMVTDCMDTEDALKGKLRLLGVELLSDMYKLNTLFPLDKQTQIPVSISRINEILSFIEISYTIGFISEMNTLILKKEFNNLASELKSYQANDKHFTFTLDEKMFNVERVENDINNTNTFNYKGQSFIKDMSVNTNKRTSYNALSFINKKNLAESISRKRTTQNSNTINKEERTKRIISIIKDKKDLPNNRDGVSIKDISFSFTDCSEKTIQRELNALVEKGELKKTGAKRWSRYAIVDK
jgi:hypothetical protein